MFYFTNGPNHFKLINIINILLNQIKFNVNSNSVVKFNDTDDTACNLISSVYKTFGTDYHICFGNGGDRTNDTTPEVDYCIKNNIELIWGLGGGKIQSSSDLLKKWEE